MSNNYFEKISNDFLSKKYGSKHKEKKLEPRSTIHIPKALSSMLGETKERGPSWGGGRGAGVGMRPILKKSLPILMYPFNI